MLSKLKSIGMGLLSIIAALFFARSQRLKRKAVKAQVKAQQVDRKAHAIKIKAETERAIDNAQAQARENNQRAKAERNATSDSERRTGRFGTADRLRK